MSKNLKEKKQKKESRSLTSQQEDFCLQYIKDYNGTQAAIRAKYSAHTAQEQASRLLSNVIVRGRINGLLEERFKVVKLDVDRVLRGLLKAAEIDIRMAYDEGGNLLPVKDMPEPLAKVISEIRTEELFDGYGKDREHIGTAKTIKVVDRLRAQELLGKHLKMFTDITEHRGLENLADQLKKARQRTCQSSTAKKK
jgi:phage terminase small subunit